MVNKYPVTNEKTAQNKKGKIFDLSLYNYLKTLTIWKTNLYNPEIIEDFIALEKTLLNTTEYSGKTINALLCPETVSDVMEIIKVANKLKIGLNAVSTGKNWGLGSNLPVRSNCAVVNLRKMNKILEINERFRYCVIQPGVTQKQLSNYLKIHYPHLMFPPTGASGHTSIVGNIMERGVGILGHRYNSLLGVEIITGNEKKVRTGYWHCKKKEDKSPTVYYKPGIGPDLNGLFTQSNFGIVTAMVVQLEPIKKRKIFALEFKEKDLSEITETFYFLREDEIIKDGLIITGMNDPRASGGNKTKRGKWLACTNISGTDEMINIAEKETRAKFKHLDCKLKFYDLEEPNDNTITPYIDILQKMYKGEPTEYAMTTMAKLGNYELKDGENIDHSKKIIGFNCALPAIPFSGPHVTRVIEELDKIAEFINIQPYYNFVGLTKTSLEGFFRVFFDRQNPQEINKAHQWNQLVHEKLSEMGFHPYRVNINQMQNIYSDNSDYWKTVKSIKQALDPNNIISPGKYCPNV